MTQQVPVLLLDDGELDDVRALLVELGVEYAHLRGGAIPERVEPPGDLFIATSRRAMLARSWSSAKDGPIKIGVVEEDSNTLRNMLRRIGFEFLVRRPVHPTALRLLLARALYRGDERRREVRVPIGCEIAYRTGIRRRTAILADLSSRGCRMLTDRLLTVGTRLTLTLPKEVTGGKPLSQKAVVKRGVEGSGRRSEHSIGVAFLGLTPAARQVIEQVLAARRSGPAVLSEQSARALEASAERSRGGEIPAAGPSSDINRRKHQRAQFEREVVCLGSDEGSRVLVGRDLSVGGMLVDRDEALEPGRSLELAIYGAAREEPFILRARVVRHTDEGTAIAFDEVPPAVATRLEAMVGSLPSVESLESSEADSVGTVVSRILETESEIG